MNITIAGIGYVGLSNAVLLAYHHHIVAVDIQPERAEAVCQGRSPVADSEWASSVKLYKFLEMKKDEEKGLHLIYDRT